MLFPAHACQKWKIFQFCFYRSLGKQNSSCEHFVSSLCVFAHIIFFFMRVYLQCFYASNIAQEESSTKQGSWAGSQEVCVWLQTLQLIFLGMSYCICFSHSTPCLWNGNSNYFFWLFILCGKSSRPRPSLQCLLRMVGPWFWLTACK